MESLDLPCCKFLLGNSLASEFYMPTFRNTLSVPSSYPPMKMKQTERSRMLAYKIRTPGNYPAESIQHSEHGESLKSRIDLPCFSSLTSAVSTLTSTIDVRADKLVCFRLINSPRTRIPSVTARFSSGPDVGDSEDWGFHINKK